MARRYTRDDGGRWRDEHGVDADEAKAVADSAIESAVRAEKAMQHRHRWKAESMTGIEYCTVCQIDKDGLYEVMGSSAAERDQLSRVPVTEVDLLRLAHIRNDLAMALAGLDAFLEDHDVFPRDA